MSILLQVILVVLAVVGIVALLWSIAGGFLTPVRAEGKNRLYALICVSGSMPGLQRTVNGLLWAIQTGVAEYDILIVDNGMDEETRLLAQKIAETEHRVSICALDELEAALTRP